MKAPDGSLAESLNENCSGLHVILFDERSLIGSTTFAWMVFIVDVAQVTQIRKRAVFRLLFFFRR